MIAQQEFEEVHEEFPMDGVSFKQSAKARASGFADLRRSSGGPTKIIRPSLIKPTREASRKASRTSWVTKTMVFFSRCWRARNSRWISRRVIGSRAPNG